MVLQPWTCSWFLWTISYEVNINRKKIVPWDKILSAHRVYMDLNRGSSGIWGGGGFSLFVSTLCLTVHGKHKHFQGWNTATATSFPFSLLGLSPLFLVFANVSKIISWHRIILIVCTIQSRTGECFLWSRCVSSWSCYGLKRGIPWQFGFSFSLFLIFLYLPVHENHKHIHCWNPTTTTSFP